MAIDFLKARLAAFALGGVACFAQRLARLCDRADQDFALMTSRSTCRALSRSTSNQGENFQVSTAPGPDGIVRRIEVEANDERSSGDWAVFALANTTDQQLDRLIVAPHFRLVNSGLFWPDLGSSRIAAITPSEGFALDRQASPDADVFLVTLEPRRGRYLHRRTGFAATCRRSICGTPEALQGSRSTPTRSTAAS